MKRLTTSPARVALGVGETLAAVLPGPAPLRDLARMLDRFGGVAVDAEAVAFDGERVDWDDVRAVRTRRLAGHLLSGALDKQVARLPLPWFPGRGLVVSAASQAALVAVVAVGVDRVGPVRRAFEVQVPSDVGYRGLLRAKTLSPGLLGTVALAHPGVGPVVLEQARRHGVPVEAADDDAVDVARRRAAWIDRLLTEGFWILSRLQSPKSRGL